MNEYQFFLTIYPEYRQSDNPKHLDKLTKMYHQYQRYLEQNISQEEILAQSEFLNLKTILMNNSLEFDNNIDLLLHNDFDETDIDLLNQIYIKHPNLFTDLVEKDIKVYIQNIIKSLSKSKVRSLFYDMKNNVLITFQVMIDEKKIIIFLIMVIGLTAAFLSSNFVAWLATFISSFLLFLLMGFCFLFMLTTSLSLIFENINQYSMPVLERIKYYQKQSH